MAIASIIISCIAIIIVLSSEGLKRYLKDKNRKD